MPPTTGGPRVPKTDRLFLALLPSAPAISAVLQLAAGLRGELDLSGTPAPERLHVTLHFLGDHVGLPQPLVESVSQVAAATAAGQAAFAVSFDRAGSFPRARGRRPLVLRGTAGVTQLAAFQRSLGQGLADAGLPHTGPDLYTPHLTLLYDLKEVAERPVWPAVEWTVQDFVLVRSRIGRGSHEVLARWPLRLPG